MVSRSTPSMVPACAVVLAVIGGAAVALHARASFTVDPMQIQLSSRATSQLVTVTNESTSEIRFEIKAFKWEHDDAGEMKLSGADEIVLFPNLVTVAPHTEQRVRVGTTASYGAREGAYRLFVEEAPPASLAGTGRPGSRCGPASAFRSFSRRIAHRRAPRSRKCDTATAKSRLV